MKSSVLKIIAVLVFLVGIGSFVAYKGGVFDKSAKVKENDSNSSLLDTFRFARKVEVYPSSMEKEVEEREILIAVSSKFATIETEFETKRIYLDSESLDANGFELNAKFPIVVDEGEPILILRKKQEEKDVIIPSSKSTPIMSSSKSKRIIDEKIIYSKDSATIDPENFEFAPSSKSAVILDEIKPNKK